VRFRKTCLAVIVVIARVRDEVLYPFFAAPSTPLRSCQTLVLTDMRQGPRPLRCPLAGTLLLALLGPSSESERIQSRTLVSGIGFTPPPLGPSPTLIVVSLFAAISPARARIQLRYYFAFRFSSIPGAWGRPLLGPSLVLIVVSVSTPPLTPPLRFFPKESVALIHSERRKGRLNIHFAPFDFYKSHLTIPLIQKIVKM
jgi:hypothetical protein